jgi:SprT-like family protein
MEHRLYTLCPIPLTIVWHENKTTYFSARREKKRLTLRLHRLFYQAPTPVLEALVRIALKKDPEAYAIVKKMAYLFFHQNKAAPESLSFAGAAYDLKEIYDRLKKRYFAPEYDAAIGWSPRSRSGKFRFITFGTYDRHRHQIRINPLLDDPRVPLFFLEFIVYHEMLHAICLPEFDTAGRCRVHTREFREKEKQFPHYESAKEWEEKSLNYFKKRKRHGGA